MAYKGIDAKNIIATFVATEGTVYITNTGEAFISNPFFFRVFDDKLLSIHIPTEKVSDLPQFDVFLKEEA